WPPLSMDPRRGGAGDLIASGGMGMFGIWQSDGLNDEGRDYGKVISFSLAVGNPTHADTSQGNINYGNGLIMNSRNGNIPNENVDADQDEGIINILPITEMDATSDDLDQWHEFWITIEPVTAADATHAVTIWVDGLLTGSRFLVTAGDSGQSPNYKNVPPFFSGAHTNLDNAIFMGSVGSRAAGTQDVDFYCVKAGVHPIPEPSSMALFCLLAGCGLFVYRCMRS
ncbi:MAG: PEP-CTERM sorting domain-containing protein, partial [Pirellulales bacterium]|nr:PEP-CTERM sorting domain-containing protein [Pirellulales bacterium]